MHHVPDHRHTKWCCHKGSVEQTVNKSVHIAMPLKAPEHVISSFARFQLQQTVLILLTPAMK
jgi:hypothetical protein